MTDSTKNTQLNHLPPPPPPPRTQDIPVGPQKATKKKVEITYPEDFEGFEPPKSIWTPRVIGNKEYEIVTRKGQAPTKTTGVLHLPGVGYKSADVLFISPCALMEELKEDYRCKPTLLRGAHGALFRRNLLRFGYDETDWRYTTLVRYNVPKLTPKAPDLRWSAAAIDDEIRAVQPKIIACMGKPVFDYLFEYPKKSRKFTMREIQGGFFDCPKYDCLLYPMDGILTPLNKPEYLERTWIDLRVINQRLQEIRGTSRPKIEQKYQVITKHKDLVQLQLDLIKREKFRQAVDCEWGGRTVHDGYLRYFQFCWAPGEAVCLQFRNEKQEYVFDLPIEHVPNVMNFYWNDPRVKFVGHNISADFPWMQRILGIDTYQRCVFDTLHALHTVNEYADLKLERNAVCFTDLGRYDLELLFWKKQNKVDEDDEKNVGYGKIPDKILIPYSQKDVDATWRMQFPIIKELGKQGLLDYYFNLLLPFTTDGFTSMSDFGLPINVEYLKEMRETFTRNREILNEEFRKDLQKEAGRLLIIYLMGIHEQEGQELFLEIVSTVRDIRESGENVQKAMGACLAQLKAFCGSEHFEHARLLFQHYLEAGEFNINSVDQLRRWLFDIKGFHPLKTTKKEGIQLSWDKVLALPPERAAEYLPAADKETIKVYAERDKMVARVQELKAVGNITKAFLKGPDKDGNEQGIAQWVMPDGRIHTNFSLTETARPRSWSPNILNWPKYVTKPIEAAFKRINEKYPEHANKPTSLRSAVQAPEGWAIIDMDLKTAEVFSLAYQSGDENMIKVLTEPDTQFARISEEDPDKVVRIAYNGNEGIPESAYDPELLVSLDDPRLLRDANGNLLHPKRDLHWEMATGVLGKPREKCSKATARNGVGKVGNFSIPYGASAPLLERMVEANTGSSPEPGTGELMINTFATRYPQADEFLKEMEKIVLIPGHWRSLSGRIRHFFCAEIQQLDEVNDWRLKGIISPLTRQARNYPMQEHVAATTARALLRFLEEARKLGLKARVGLLLYDAITVFAPLEEVKVAAQLLRDCLTTIVWKTKGGDFSFGVDTDFQFRWGVKPSDKEKEILERYLA